MCGYFDPVGGRGHVQRPECARCIRGGVARLRSGPLVNDLDVSSWYCGSRRINHSAGNLAGLRLQLGAGEEHGEKCDQGKLKE